MFQLFGRFLDGGFLLVAFEVLIFDAFRIADRYEAVL